MTLLAVREELPDSEGTRRNVAMRVLALLNAFAEPGSDVSLSLTQLARRAQLSVSTTHRIVADLVRGGALVRGADGRYTVGLRVWEIGVQAPVAQVLRATTLPYLEELRRHTATTISLSVLDEDDVVMIEVLRGARRHPSLQVGARLSGPEHSAGRLLISLSPSDSAAALHRADDVDRARLQRHFATIRAEQIARTGPVNGWCSVSAPVRGSNGQTVAAVTNWFPAATAPINSHDSLLRGACQAMSAALGFTARSRA